MSQSRQLAAVMFTDIVGYTTLMGNDERKAFELLRQNREIQKPVIEEFGGQWIKELGDGVLASFPAVSNAVYAAIKIQEMCAKSRAFELRIGIHQGEVVFENGDIFGDAVNIASRLQSAAPPGGILISESVHRNVANKTDISSEFVKQESFKHVRDPISVYRVARQSAGTQEFERVKPRLGSIIPEFDCDIQVSFRYNDNKYDSWVTEFIEKLGQELGATLKDKLSIYSDRTPETERERNLVSDRSAGVGIKPLIFIPIISQTYCDINSSIWKGEFGGFQIQSNSDRIGPGVRLPNGNSASRVIPVKIHDIDVEDTRLLEAELSGALRSIDFIYREDGVNRPLRPFDDEKSNTSFRPLYRNQINKVANAIKEIVTAIKIHERGPFSEPVSHFPTARQIVPNVVATSISPTIKVEIIDRQRPNIYLAWTSGDLKESREEMAIILQKAGFNVLPVTDCPADDDIFKGKVAEDLEKCVCSL
ncbi:MAG TPA: adenylate/guanylate cyclase domain-containing protein, partial [Puia sp.]|nr:adenylate/guanylate cyclase domain-containing protein [Puia sp.]